MADTNVSIGENTPEYIAYKLMQDIAGVEQKKFVVRGVGELADREWILSTYRECLSEMRRD